MQHIRSLPTNERLTFDYDHLCYNPNFTTSDPLAIAFTFINMTTDNLRILDLGTGCGVLGLSLKYMFPSLDVTCSDIDPHALKIARKNARKIGVEAHFVKSDMFAKTGKFDLIITSLPSFTSDQPSHSPLHTTVDPELNLYQRLLAEAPADVIICEIQQARQAEFDQLTTDWKEIVATDYARALLRKTNIQTPPPRPKSPKTPPHPPKKGKT